MTMQPLNTVSPINERIRHAEILAASNLLPQAFRQSPPNVLVAIEYGMALGIDPIVALNEINVINGTPSLSASLMVSLAHQAGHKVRIEGDAKSATCTIIRADDPEFEHKATWDEAKAKAAGLFGKGHWTKDPATMLKWRAASECVRFACPEVLGGLKYSADEVADFSGPQTPATVTVTTAPHVTITPDEAFAALEAVVSADSNPQPVVESEPVKAAKPKVEAKAIKEQLAGLAAHMTRLGLSKAEMLTIASEVAGRALKSSNDLTFLEAIEVDLHLAAINAPDEDGVVDAQLVDPWDEDGK